MPYPGSRPYKVEMTVPELEAMAQNAISYFIVLASQRIAQGPDELGSQKLLLG